MAHTLIAVTSEELQEMVTTAVRKALDERGPGVAKRYLDAKEIAKHFGVSRATVQNWIRHEDCPCMSRGKVLRFELAAVEAWFRGRTPSLKRVK